MTEYILSRLREFNIDTAACIPLSKCTVVRPYLLERHGITGEGGSVIIFAVPYLTPTSAGERNISSYAVSRDYHLFFSDLFGKLLPELRERYPQNVFAGFTDHSPIMEIRAAALAGLGVLGKNHLLITEKYSSYVFLGEIITDARLDTAVFEPRECEGCGRCISACPALSYGCECISSLTQKKGELTPEERARIAELGCAWGCDICQQVCPHTKRAMENGTVFTPIRFFRESTTPHLTSEDIEGMSDSEFSCRAYSWRGRATIIRNLKILEGGES